MVKGKTNEVIVREYLSFKEECIKQGLVEIDEIIKLYGTICCFE